MTELGTGHAEWCARQPVGAFAERFVGTVRRECLDHMLVFNGRQFEAVLSEFVDHYNRRPSPLPRAGVAVVDLPTSCVGPVSWTDESSKIGPARWAHPRVRFGGVWPTDEVFGRP
jgi:Integrase core domain